ncbi:PAS domain-containing protein [Rubellimicrobium aerolatum]|nr:PAS domain-containing protein [Rubellimicrobium aerolatum]
MPKAELRTARETGQAPNVRWHMRKDGSRVFIEGIVRPLTGPDGAVTGYVKVGQDVTERRAAVQALHESEARFRNMADHAQVMMWVADDAREAWKDRAGLRLSRAQASNRPGRLRAPCSTRTTRTSSPTSTKKIR